MSDCLGSRYSRSLAFGAVGLFVSVQVFGTIFVDGEEGEVPLLAALEFACRDGEIEIDSFAYVFFQEFAETAVVELCDFDSKRRGSVSIGDRGGAWKVGWIPAGGAQPVRGSRTRVRRRLVSTSRPA